MQHSSRRSLRRATSCAALAVLGAAELSAQHPAAPARSGSDVSVAGLETDAAATPLGIDDRSPRLSWRLESRRRDVRQSAYHVLVATRPELLREGRADVWDSREVAGTDPWATYDGTPLTSRTRYHWSVRVRTNRGASSWSRPSWFETALLDARDWRGRWIAGPERAMATTPAEGAADDARIRGSGEFCRPTAWPTVPLMRLRPNDQGECRAPRPAPMLRRSFTVTKPVARARLYASGLGFADLSINGALVSDRVLDPMFTDYSRTVLYTTTDVTGLVRRGENVVGALLGSGKFDDAATTWDWGWDKAEWRGTPRLRLDLVVTYADGSEERVSSDSAWRTSVDGPLRYDSFYLGETFDARRVQRGWNAVGFDASRWAPARLVDAPTGVPRAQVAEPSRVVSVRAPGRRSAPAPGVVVYDVGQNLSGWATIRVRAPAGTPIEIFYSEKRDASGRASTEGNALVAGQLQTDYYVARGGGVDTWAPRFTYKGFQYVQLSGPGGAPLPRGVSAEVVSVQQVRTALATTSTFASSHRLVDRVHAMTSWALQGNMQSGIITDTPIYEKNPWTGDAQLSAGAASTMFDTRRLYAKLFQDMVDAQTEQGEVPLLAPSNENYGYVGKPAFKPPACCGATPPWDAFWFVVPWEAYQRFGDRRALETTYPTMRRYLDDWIPRWTTRDGDDSPYTLTAGLGDWDPPPGTDPVIRLSATAYYAHFARIAADAARVLGRPADAARYDSLFTRIRDAFNAKFLTAEGIYRDTTTTTGPGAPPTVLVRPPLGAVQHTSQLLPLAFGLAPDSLRAPLAAKLAADVTRQRGGNAFVGILGSRYFHVVLTEAGFADVAFAAATQSDYPSYGYWADSLGWTTLAEYWEPTSRSRNHHMFGAVAQWFYEHLAGIRASAPGYGRIEFNPAVPAGLDSVSASIETVRGRVATRWRRTTAGLELDVVVPPTATGRVLVPAAGPAAVTEIGAGRVAADRAEGVRQVGVESGRVVYEIGSGHYRFRVAR
ncbi:MAG TPA: family 78 glycoside hydrolase catalytic domain [Gemmatimonadaceae bacterium]|nr:family 78 glycoside hydrolase catalytic domain [Gemmatimonadaceae bacterium]